MAISIRPVRSVLAGEADLVIWDNQHTMHRVRRFDATKARDMRGTTVAGDLPTAEQVAA
jgi:alpha-ketoglutarate-dependent 2,4-dichlorophenoxyacetate dioxygenase